MFKNLGIKSFYYGVLGLALLILFYGIHSLFLPLLIAFLFANLLRPVIHYFESRGFSQITVISGIYLIFLTFAILFFTFIMPQLIQEGAILSKELPHYLTNLKAFLSDFELTLQTKLSFVEIPDFTQLAQDFVASKATQATGYISSYVSSVLSLFTYALIVPFIAFYILKDMHLMRKELLTMVPNRHFEMFVLLFYKIGQSIQLYIRGQLIDASFVGIATGLGLALIGFPYALTIGLIAGIGNLVPYFGPILGAIPAIIIIIVSPDWGSPESILMVVAVFMAVQVVETIFVYPTAVGNSVNLHPLLILLSLLVGGEFAGILGMIIIIPLIAILKVTLELLHKYLKEYRVLT